MSARWTVLAALCWMGCSGGRQGTPAPQPSAAERAAPVAKPAPAPAPLQPSAAARPWSPWRIVGSPSPEVASIGPHLDGLGQWIATPAQATGALSLDLSGGARVQLAQDTLVWAFERAPDALVLVHGRLTLQRLPDAPRVGEAAPRIVTAHATVAVPAAAELAIGARADAARGAAVGVVVVRGSIELWRVGVAPQLLLAEQTSWPVIAGVTLRGAKTAVDAQRALDDALRPAHLRPALVAADERLVAALATLSELRGQGDRLLAAISPQHAAADPHAAPPKTEREVRAYQRSLTDHARSAHAAREALQLMAEQSLLQHALECSTPRIDEPPCAALQAWSERFGTALDASR